MTKETADKDLLVFIFKIHILSLKLTYQKSAKLMTSLHSKNYSAKFKSIRANFSTI